MAEKDENSLIGYDPLAWMHEKPEQQPMPPAAIDGAEVESTADAVPSLEALPDSESEDAGWQEAAFEAATTAETPVFETTATIALEPVLSIQNVAQLHERLLAALDDGEKIEIDASAVAMIDTACLQLLLILKRTAIKQQKVVVIDFPSEKFIEAAELLGISQMLEVDQAAAGFF